MTDLMTWLYDHYIKPQIESQPKDATEAMWFDRLDNELYPQEKESLQAVHRAGAQRGPVNAAALSPAARPVAQAIWRLNPPV